MVNSDGEKLVFNKPVTVDGPVESWLVNVEDAMQRSLQQLMAKALQDYNRVLLEHWIFGYPVQVILAVVRIAW